MMSIEDTIGNLPRITPKPGKPPERRPFQPDIPLLSDLDAHHPGVAAAVDAAMRWAKRRQEFPAASLVIMGPVGTGKTSILNCCMWAVRWGDGNAAYYPGGRMFKADDLIQLIDGRTEPGVIIGERVPFIGVDDIGTERRLEYVSADSQATELQRRYESLIDYCYRTEKGMVITSNLTAEQLKQRIGPRSWSRLMAMAPRGFIVDMGDAPDYRLVQGGRA